MSSAGILRASGAPQRLLDPALLEEMIEQCGARLVQRRPCPTTPSRPRPRCRSLRRCAFVLPTLMKNPILRSGSPCRRCRSGSGDRCRRGRDVAREVVAASNSARSDLLSVLHHLGVAGPMSEPALEASDRPHLLAQLKAFGTRGLTGSPDGGIIARWSFSRRLTAGRRHDRPCRAAYAGDFVDDKP